jgi:glutathionyl-hydroquinone reductase
MSVAAQAECQWKVLWLPATDRDFARCGPQVSNVRADQRPTSRRFGELVVRYELQVGTACPWRRREDASCTRAAGASFRWLGCRTTTPPTCC